MDVPNRSSAHQRSARLNCQTIRGSGGGICIFIGKTPQAVMLHLARNRFAGTLPEDMSLAQLRQFSMILKNRRDYGRRTELNAHTPVFVGEPMIPDEELPF